MVLSSNILVKDYNELAELYGTWYYLVVRHGLMVLIADGNDTTSIIFSLIFCYSISMP
jgi:hypothetical protein